MIHSAVKTEPVNEIEVVASQIVDAAFQTHRTLGPGLFESAYQICMAHELRKRNLHVDCERPLPILYDGIKIENDYRIDPLVEDLVVIENKTVEQVAPIHEAQLLTYLRLGGYRLGFLINWNVRLIKHGVYRKINPAVQPFRSARPTNP